DPLEVVKVGDVLDFKIISLDTDRRRIGLSRKSNSPGSGAAPGGGTATGGAASGESTGGSQRRLERPGNVGHSGAGHSGTAAKPGEKRRVVAVKPGQGGQRPDAGRARGADGQRGERRDAGGASHTGNRPGTNRPAANVNSPRPPADDDGTMYNPFAEALRKMEERKNKGRKK
ncbi:MAG: hypothetical protein LBT39_05785, partial [Treponema sp.]|nr:hypothetical protein [Treponema sp.]